MGVDITTYMAAIGVFYSATHIYRSLSLPKLTIRFNFTFKLCCALSTFALLALGGFLKHDKFTFYKIILLMICMDIHPNPGPNNTDTIHTLDILHLNTRSIRNKFIIILLQIPLLAHLSRRLICEFIVYPWIRRPSYVVRPSVRRPSSSSTMLKHLLLRNRLADQGQILCGASLGRGNESLFAASGSHDQDGRHAHIW